MSVVWLFVVLTLLGFFTYAGLSFAPWVPAYKKDLGRIVAIANLKPGEVFYELGCGDGRNLVAVARRYHCRVIGIEIFPLLYFYAKIQQWRHRDLPITVKFGNLFRQNLGGANVVYFYGLPGTLKEKIKEKLVSELPPGARIISYVFKIDGWTPTLKDKPSPDNPSIYLYEIDKQR